MLLGVDAIVLFELLNNIELVFSHSVVYMTENDSISRTWVSR
jgi:hypothetical protein